MNTTLIQTAVAKRGAPWPLKGRPAIISIDGIEFTSAVPKFDGEAIHINELARRLCEQRP